MHKPELLSPVGNLEAFYSAIANGADAVYFAGKKFGARAHLDNFSNDEIIMMIEYAHRFNVKVYITINTVIKEDEFSEVKSFVDFLINNKVDAIIVQDWGLLFYIRNRYPDFSLHASTQMNIHSLAQATHLASLGVKRIIFARETPLENISEIIKKVKIETEVFIHGALCVSYSGNCYFSSLLGKNSGNRGRCYQPCRLPYELVDVTNKSYLLSPKDLMTIDELDKIVAAGITSLKIEGRMKRSEYVGLVTKTYRLALDKQNNPNAKKNLSLMFNREFTKGFILNETNHSFTNISSPNHIGIEVGIVTNYQKGFVDVKLSERISAGDALRFVGTIEDAIIVNQIIHNNKKITIAYPNMVVRLPVHRKIEVNTKVLKTTDACLIKEIKQTKQAKIPLEAMLEVENDLLKLSLNDGKIKVTSLSTNKVQMATKPDINKRLLEQINKTGNEVYYFSKIINNTKDIFLPIKDINELRRRAIQELDFLRLRRPDYLKIDFTPQKLALKQTNKLYIKVRTLDQLQLCLDLKVCDVLVEKREWCQYANEITNIHYLAPRISNELTQGLSSIYDNITNATSVYFKHLDSYHTVGLSLELSLDEIAQIVSSYQIYYHEKANLLVMVYGYYHLMITKHCLINKAYGLNKKYCSKCYQKQHYLRDRLGFMFPLIDDGDCNLITLNSRRLHLIDYIAKLQKIGISNFLIDFTIEDNANEIADIIKTYTQVFLGKEASLRLSNVTYGHIKEGVL